MGDSHLPSAKQSATATSIRGEVATFVDVSQFETGESAFECVAFSAALCKYMGAPDGEPTGSPEDVDQLADLWYGKLTGNIDPSNTFGMSLDQLHSMLDGIGLHWRDLAIDANSAHESDIANVKASLLAGKPVLICGHEDSFYDMDLGDKVPYAWTPTGNHCIVATGIASDGNLLVRDMANVGPHGLRPGPRRYDINHMFLISGTEIEPYWLGDVPMTIDLNNPVVANYFTATSDGKWQCKQTGNIVQFGMLNFYRSYGQGAYCGLTYLGLPKSNETPIAGHPGVVKQEFERGWLVYDPNHVVDTPPGAGAVYPMHLPN
jgi:hypothetical protein